MTEEMLAQVGALVAVVYAVLRSLEHGSRYAWGRFRKGENGENDTAKLPSTGKPVCAATVNAMEDLNQTIKRIIDVTDGVAKCTQSNTICLDRIIEIVKEVDRRQEAMQIEMTRLASKYNA